jgi:hypothetical protein
LTSNSMITSLCFECNTLNQKNFQNIYKNIHQITYSIDALHIFFFRQISLAIFVLFECKCTYVCMYITSIHSYTCRCRYTKLKAIS